MSQWTCGLQFQQPAEKIWQKFRTFRFKNWERLKDEDNIFETVFSNRHVPVDTWMQLCQFCRKKYCHHSGKLWIRNRNDWKENIELPSKLKKKQASQFFSGHENSNFDFLLINCGHNSHLSALKNPRTTKMKLFSFQDNHFAGEIFQWKQKRSFGNAPEKSLAGFWKKNRIKHRKGWKKKEWTSFKNKKKIPRTSTLESIKAVLTTCWKKLPKSPYFLLSKKRKHSNYHKTKLKKSLLAKKSSCDWNECNFVNAAGKVMPGLQKNLHQILKKMSEKKQTFFKFWKVSVASLP